MYGSAPDMSGERASANRTPSSLELIYAFAEGLVMGFIIAAALGIILAWAIKVTEGIDGE
jgi:hypothetical protein